MKFFKPVISLMLTTLLLVITSCGTSQNIDGVDVETDFQGRGLKLFQVSVFPLYEATREALKNMNIKIDDVAELGENYQLTSETKDLNIIIDLEEVGPKISRMRIRAEEGGFFSFKNNEEMAMEILKETTLVLESKGHFDY